MSRSVLLLLVALLPFAALPAAAQSGLCRAAITAAEAEFAIPSRLLHAISRLESGRRDPQTGQFEPWPWTINAEGRGSFFPSREAAIAAVQALQASGVRSIDVGCMQINLRHHPEAFASLEQAFEPLANARYAARFLTALQQRAGSWQAASGHYHSQTPELAEAYRSRLAQFLAAEQNAPAGWAGPAVPPQSPGAVTLAAVAGGLGRGLEAYRQVPIPLAGGVAPPRPASGGAAAALPAPAPAPQRGVPLLAAAAGRPSPLPAMAPGRGVVPAAAAPGGPPSPPASPPEPARPGLPPPAARAPHVVAEVGPGGIGGRRLF